MEQAMGKQCWGEEKPCRHVAWEEEAALLQGGAIPRGKMKQWRHDGDSCRPPAGKQAGWQAT